MSDLVIFLDCDGVLNNTKTTERIEGFLGLDPALVQRCLDLLTRTGARVVLSSTWRLYPHILAAVTAAIPPSDVTPEVRERRIGQYVSRGTEIAMWLAQHPEVTRYAIIDDDHDMLAGQAAFFTNPKRGPPMAVVERVARYLLSDD